MSANRVVVTGAAGRIGQLLIDLLRGRGSQVVGIDVAPGADIQVDLSAIRNSTSELRSALAEAGAVVHLAALMSWDESRAEEVYQVNVTGTLNLLRSLESATATRPPRVVLASTGEVYPELAPAYLPIDESHPTRPTSHYGLSKLMAEQAVQFYGRRTSSPPVILRFAHTQRASELADPESFFSGPRFFVSGRLRRLRETQPQSETIREAIRLLQDVDRPGERVLLLARGPDGTPYRMGIADARDIVEGIILALDHPAAPGETFNIGPAAAFSFDEAVPYMASRWGLPFVPVDLPLTPYRYETSVDKARRILGYRPRYTVFDMIDAATPRVVDHV
jgi:UDP-glucose 4-epimerase